MQISLQPTSQHPQGDSTCILLISWGRTYPHLMGETLHHSRRWGNLGIFVGDIWKRQIKRLVFPPIARKLAVATLTDLDLAPDKP